MNAGKINDGIVSTNGCNNAANSGKTETGAFRPVVTRRRFMQNETNQVS